MAEPIVPELLELMPDVMTIERCISSDSFGVRKYDELNPVPVRCRLVGRTVTVRTPEGVEVPSHLQATIGGALGFTVKDRYTLPARYATYAVNGQPEALTVYDSTDENGPHHQVVYF